MILLLPEVCQRIQYGNKIHRGRGNILEDDIMGAMLGFIEQNRRRLIRSLKINAKENMKFLKELLNPGWMPLLLDISTSSSKISCLCMMPW
jgi:hypothetical protein